MNDLNRLIRRINFKRVTAAYLILAVTAGIFAAGFLGFVYRDKLEFSYTYHRITEKIEHGEITWEAAKPSLADYANHSSDLTDILILNGKNKILYSAKNSLFAKEGSLELTGSSEKHRGYLIDRNNPNLYFRLLKNDRIALPKAILGEETKVRRDYEDDFFYESDYSAKKVYFLSYAVDKASGNKIYFISDIQPVANGEFYLKAAAALAVLFFMLYWVLLALWVYANALKSRLNAAMWGILVLFANLAGLFIYLAYRQNRQTCFKCGTVQNRTNLYCTFCGAKLGTQCDRCHTAADDDDNYCKNCGSAINRKAGKP